MRRLLESSVVVIACVWAFACAAMKPATVPLDELYMRADQVLLIQVVEGRVLGSGDQNCGARYSGRIERSFKGQPAGRQIDFGYYFTLKIGASYLVFLKGDPGEADEYLSASGPQMSAMADFLARCKSRLPPFTIMQLGNGALEIVDSAENGSAVRLIVLNKYVAPPLSLRVHKHDREEVVALPDFLRYVERNGYITGKDQR